MSHNSLITLPLNELSLAAQYGWLSEAGRADVARSVAEGVTPREAVLATFDLAILEWLFADKPGFNVLTFQDVPLLRRSIRRRLTQLKTKGE